MKVTINYFSGSTFEEDKSSDVKADFASGLTDVAAFYSAANNALSGDKDKTLLVENTFLTTAVLWEGFVSDLIVAYINRDSHGLRSTFAPPLRITLRRSKGAISELQTYPFQRI